VGVIITVITLAIFTTVPALAALKMVSGVILVLAVLFILLATLKRETGQ